MLLYGPFLSYERLENSNFLYFILRLVCLFIDFIRKRIILGFINEFSTKQQKDMKFIFSCIGFIYLFYWSFSVLLIQDILSHFPFVTIVMETNGRGYFEIFP